MPLAIAMEVMTAAKIQRSCRSGPPEDGKRPESKTVLISRGLITPMLAVTRIKTATETTWKRYGRNNRIVRRSIGLDKGGRPSVFLLSTGCSGTTRCIMGSTYVSERHDCAAYFLFWHAIQTRLGREVILPFSNCGNGRLWRRSAETPLIPLYERGRRRSPRPRYLATTLSF